MRAHFRTTALRTGRTAELLAATGIVAPVVLRIAHHRALRTTRAGILRAVLIHHRRAGALRPLGSAEILLPTTKAARATKHRSLRAATLRALSELMRATLRSTHRRGKAIAAASTLHHRTTRTARTALPLHHGSTRTIGTKLTLHHRAMGAAITTATGRRSHFFATAGATGAAFTKVATARALTTAVALLGMAPTTRTVGAGSGLGIHIGHGESHSNGEDVLECFHGLRRSGLLSAGTSAEAVEEFVGAKKHLVTDDCGSGIELRVVTERVLGGDLEAR
jgi:hypothetical protein